MNHDGSSWFIHDVWVMITCDICSPKIAIVITLHDAPYRQHLKNYVGTHRATDESMTGALSLRYEMQSSEGDAYGESQ